MCRGTTPYKEAEASGALETIQLCPEQDGDCPAQGLSYGLKAVCHSARLFKELSTETGVHTE